jgi:hypothetical protein
VGVIKLDLVELGELVPVGVVELEALDDVLDGSTAEEVLLLESQLFAFVGGVVGVEHASDVLSSLAFHNRLVIHTVIELLEVEFVAWSGPPEAQSVGVVGVESWNRRVVSHSHNNLATVPVANSWVASCLGDGSTEAYLVGDVRTLNLPRISLGKPVVRKFYLETILNLLLKDTIIVSYAVAHSGDVQSGH